MYILVSSLPSAVLSLLSQPPLLQSPLPVFLLVYLPQVLHPLSLLLFDKEENRRKITRQTFSFISYEKHSNTFSKLVYRLVLLPLWALLLAHL
jgi:hypothetical protein